MKRVEWEKILRKTSVKEDPWLEKEVYRFLKKMERAGGELVEEEIREFSEKEFSNEIMASALQKKYVDIWIAPEGCPPELDRMFLTKKGKEYLKNK